jgi:hypothetical protein
MDESAVSMMAARPSPQDSLGALAGYGTASDSEEEDEEGAVAKELVKPGGGDDVREEGLDGGVSTDSETEEGSDESQSSSSSSSSDSDMDPVADAISSKEPPLPRGPVGLPAPSVDAATEPTQAKAAPLGSTTPSGQAQTKAPARQQASGVLFLFLRPMVRLTERIAETAGSRSTRSESAIQSVSTRRPLGKSKRRHSNYHSLLTCKIIVLKLLATDVNHHISDVLQVIDFVVANDFLRGVELKPGEADGALIEEISDQPGAGEALIEEISNQAGAAASDVTLGS